MRILPWLTRFETAALVSASWPKTRSSNAFVPMAMHNANYELLLAAARLLQPLLEDCVCWWLHYRFDDSDAAASRSSTLDVDAIAEIASYVEYAKFSDRLRAIGHVKHCRRRSFYTLETWWNPARCDAPGRKVLGFSNRWYSARDAGLRPGARFGPNLEIRLVAPPHFLATKLECSGIAVRAIISTTGS